MGLCKKEERMNKAEKLIAIREDLMNTINELEKELGVEIIDIAAHQGVQIYKGIEKIFSKEELTLEYREDEDYPFQLEKKIGDVKIYQLYAKDEIDIKEWEVK